MARVLPRHAQARGLQCEMGDQRRPRGAAPGDGRVLPWGGWQRCVVRPESACARCSSRSGTAGQPAGDRRDRRLPRGGGGAVLGCQDKRPGLPGLPCRAPPAHTHEQRPRAHEPRYKAPHTDRAGVPQRGNDDTLGGGLSWRRPTRAGRPAGAWPRWTRWKGSCRRGPASTPRCACASSGWCWLPWRRPACPRKSPSRAMNERILGEGADLSGPGRPFPRAIFGDILPDRLHQHPRRYRRSPLAQILLTKHGGLRAGCPS